MIKRFADMVYHCMYPVGRILDPLKKLLHFKKQSLSTEKLILIDFSSFFNCFYYIGVSGKGRKGGVVGVRSTPIVWETPTYH